MMWRVVPTSVALHMADHLGTSRLAKAFLTAATTDNVAGIEKAYYLLLAHRAAPAKAYDALVKFFRDEAEVFEDFVAQAFITILAQETVMESQQIEQVVDLLEEIQSKYRFKIVDKKVKYLAPNDPRMDIRNRLMLRGRKSVDA